MNLIITKNLIKKISVMEHILSAINKDENLINGILFKNNGMLQAANRTLNMSFKLTAAELGLTPDLPASDFILPELAYKFLKNLTVGSTVEIVPVKENLIEIVVDSGKRRKKNKAEFATQPCADYIAISKPDAPTMQKLNAEWFKDAIGKCSFAISDNNAKPIYTAAHLVADGEKIVAYAIDGFKAAVVANSVDTAVGKFILSIPQEIIKILGSVEFADTVTVGFNDNHTAAVFVTDDSTIIQGNLYTGNPVLFDSWLNKGEFSFSLQTKELVNIVKQICLFKSTSAAPMRMTVRKDEIVCTFSNEKTRYENTVEIANNTLSEGEVVIGLNPDALLSTLKNCSEEETTFKFTTPLTPLEIYNGDLSAIVVPMRISQEG